MAASIISAYRLTLAELSGLDQKTREGLRPLVESLNVVLQQLIKNANAIADVVTPITQFTTDGSGGSYVDLVNPLTTVPRCVLVANLYPDDGAPIASAYGFWWTMTATGLRLLFTGLLADTRYNFAVRAQ